MNYQLKEKLCNEILPLVTKPGRYLGNEYNVIIKDHSKVELKIALAFPDIYDLGMSHLGLKIFYEILNARSPFVAERVFAPWPDMVELMQKENIPLYTLESYTPVKGFDILAISLQHELCYTTALNMLYLAGIPLYSEQRKENDPIVIVGGHATFNPEPTAPFFDVFVMGDGEETILQISETVLALKKSGAPRKEILHQLAKIKGVYVPSLFQVSYTEDRFIKEINPIVDDIPKRILRSVVDLEEAYYPTRQIVPYIETSHDRIALEIQRGCTRGCRFCQAGYITRPRRERSIQTLVTQAKEGIAQTGLSEVALLSLSSSDYDGIKELVTRLANHFEPMGVSLSLPSLRLDTFSIDVAKLTQRVRKSGFTFAVEAGSERLRNVINKTITNADLEQAIVQVFSNGWLNAKLYFMVGLPTETYEDLEETVWLINRVGELARKHAKRHCKITASFSVFVPKPHSAFESAEQLDRAEVQRRIFWIKDRVRSNVVRIKWHDPNQSYLEGIFSRGDRRVADVIYRAWEKGCYLDNWSDQFDMQKWEDALKEAGMNGDFYAIRVREKDEILPWAHIDSGITRTFLLEEYTNAIKENTMGDCSIDKFCVACGLEDCTHAKANEKFLWPYQKTSDYEDTGSGTLLVQHDPASTHIRIKFAKTDELRFIGHLDLMRTFTAAIRRSSLPIAWSQGFSPQMKFHLAMALSLGYSSISEYAEFQLTTQMTADEFAARLSCTLPSGLEILDCWTISPQSPSFGKTTSLASYHVTHFPNSISDDIIREKIQTILNQTEIIVTRETKEGTTKKMNIRPLIETITYHNDSEQAVDLLLKISSTGNARPEEIMEQIIEQDEKTIKLLHFKRTGLYTEISGFPQLLDRMGEEGKGIIADLRIQI